MHDDTTLPAPLLGAPLNVIVLGPQAFAETLEAQHTPVIQVTLQPPDDDSDTGE